MPSHGLRGTGPTGSVSSADPNNVVWNAFTSMPFERHGMASVVRNERIFFFGGFALDGTAVNEVWEYDPSAGTWTQSPALNFARGGASAAIVGDEVWVVGGASAVGAPALDTTEKAAMQPVGYPLAGQVGFFAIVPALLPAPRVSHECVALNGFLYVIGGRSDHSLLSPTYDSILR